MNCIQQTFYHLKKLCLRQQSHIQKERIKDKHT
jgi:hypothetical protein